MASLIEKLGSTISGKVSSSVSGFGAGAKSAFIGANPALFAPVAGVMFKGFEKLMASNATIAKRNDAKEERARGFKEETDRENAKVFSDMQRTLDTISDDIRKILEILLKKDKGSGIGAALGGILAALKKAFGGFLDELVRLLKKLPALLSDLFKAIRRLPSAIADFFKFLRTIPDLFRKAFPKTLDGLKSFGKTLSKIFGDSLKGVGAALKRGLDALRKFFRFDVILDFFKSIPAKFKSIFKLDDLGKQFRSLRNVVLLTIGFVADKFSDILAGVKNNKGFSAISSLVGDFVKGIGNLISDAVNIVKGAAAGLLGRSATPTRVAGAAGDAARVAGAADDLSAVGKVFAPIAALAKGASGLLAGPLRFFAEITDVMGFVKGIGKVLGPIGVIFSIFDGISTATDTAKLQSIFGKFDITMQDRISGFVGGFIGGFGGLFDLLAKLMGIEIEGESIQSSLTKTVTLMTDSIFEGIKSFLMFIGKILTSEPAKDIFASAKELFSTVADGIGKMFGFLKDMFFSDAFQKVIGVLGTILGKAISGVIDAVKSVVEIVVALFKLDFTKVKEATGNLVGIVVNGIKNALSMVANGIIWAINKLMDTLKIPSSFRMSYFDTGLGGANETPAAPALPASATSRENNDRATEAYNNSNEFSGQPGFEQTEPSKPAAPAVLRRSPLMPSLAASSIPPGFLEKIIAAESGGRNIANQSGPDGKPTSSAFGIVQITKDTFEDAVKRAKPGSALAGKTFSDMKADINLQKLAFEDLTKFNHDQLIKRGIPVNESSMYLAHKLGAGGAARLLSFDDDRLLKDAVSDQQYAANPMMQKYKTVGDFKRWSEGKMGVPGAASSASSPMAMSPQQQSYNDEVEAWFAKFANMPMPSQPSTPAAPPPAPSAPPLTPKEKDEKQKTSDAAIDTASNTGNIVKANEEQAKLLSDMGMEVEVGTQLHQIHLDKIDAYHKKSIEQAELLRKQQQTQFDAEQKFLRERKNLELEFLRQVEGDIRDALNKALGPGGMGVTGESATLNAYRTYGNLLEKPFSSALTKVFGESGGAYGQIFSKLAGSYINQAAQSILPAMGIDTSLFNRALSNYTAGKQVRDQYKLAQTEFNITKAEYDAAAAKVTLADRLNATRPGKVSQIKLEQIAKVDALESALQQKGVSLAAAGKTKDANKSMYTEDLIFAMTGLPTGIRSMMGYEDGQDQLTKQLTMMVGGDVAKTAFGGAGLQDYMNQYRQMYGEQLKGQTSVAEQTAALQGQVGINNAEMQLAVSDHHTNNMSQVLGGHLQGMSRIIGSKPSDQQSSGGGFFETLGNIGKAVSSVGKFFGFGGTSSSYKASGGIDEHVFNPDSLGETSILGTLKNFGNTLTTGIKNIFTPSTSVGGGGSIPGVRGATVPTKMTGTDIAGNFLGSMISNKLGISGPAAGIVSSGLRDLFGGQGFGKTSSYIQGPGTFGSSLFNIFGLKSGNTSSLGGTLNTALNAYQLYGSLASGSLASSIGSGASFLGTASGATYGTTLGSQQSMMLAAQEAGMGAAPGSFGAKAGSVGTVAAGILGGHYLGRAVSGGYSTGGSGNSMVNVGTAAGAAIAGTKLGATLGAPLGPIGIALGALVGGLLGGTVNRLFGRKPKAVVGSGLQVTMGGEDGASGQAYSDWFQKGGKYRSNRSGRDFSSIDPSLLQYFGETTMELQKAYGEMASSIGLDANSLKGFSKYYDISLSGLSPQQSAERIQETMKQYARDMLTTQYGDIARFSLDLGDGKREDILDTFNRLSESSKLVDYWMRAFGNSVEDTAKFLTGVTNIAGIDKLDVANRKGLLIEAFGGEEAFNREMGEAFSALYTPQEQAAFARDAAIQNTQGILQAVSVSPEIKAYLDKFAGGGITKAEDVEAARLAYRAAIDQALGSGDLAAWQQLVVAGDQFMNAANLSLQAAQMNKEAAEPKKTADEFFGFTAVEDFSMGIANGIAEAAPEMAGGPASMFNLGAENLTGVVDRSFVSPYYGDGSPISGLVSNAGAGGMGTSTIVLQPSVIDNSVMSNPSSNIYVDNNAVRDYHPILSIDVRNVTSGYLGLGSK